MRDMNRNEFGQLPHQELFSDKLERTYWSEVNKRYLLRIYEPLNRVVELVSNPKWSDVINDMLGYVHPGYYSCVYKSLKEIGVISYNHYRKCLVKGENWDRFYSDDDWSWFYMNTSSGMKSYELRDRFGLPTNRVYPSNSQK